LYTFDFEILRSLGLDSWSYHFDNFGFHKDWFEVGMIVEDTQMFGVVVGDKDLIAHIHLILRVGWVGS